jgi:aminoglycoside phosphotransferase (APT) family kinase protein
VQWRPLHDVFRPTIEAVRQHSGDLPQSVAHGDAWPGIAVLADTCQAGVTLIDWETSGLGLPLPDLGHCLLAWHLDTDLPRDQPEAWLIRPDEERIAAVAERALHHLARAGKRYAGHGRPEAAGA